MDQAMVQFLQQMQALIDQSMGGGGAPASETIAEASMTSQAATVTPAAEAPAPAEEAPADYEALLAEYNGLKAIMSAYMPADMDLDTEMDRVGTNRRGEVIYSPVEQQEEQVPPSQVVRPPARKTPGRAASNGTSGNVQSMSIGDKIEYGKRMDAADKAGRPIA